MTKTLLQETSFIEFFGIFLFYLFLISHHQIMRNNPPLTRFKSLNIILTTDLINYSFQERILSWKILSYVILAASNSNSEWLKNQIGMGSRSTLLQMWKLYLSLWWLFILINILIQKNTTQTCWRLWSFFCERCKTFECLHHTIFVDGFYTSINLRTESDKMSLYVTVTIAKNRLLEDIKTNK